MTELQYRRAAIDAEEETPLSGILFSAGESEIAMTPDRPDCSAWLTAALDELDYGLLLVSRDARVMHANHTAVAGLDDGHPLQLIGQHLCLRYPRDAAPLNKALDDAASRGMRRLLTIGEHKQRIGIAVVPLRSTYSARAAMALVILGKRQMCEQLSIQGYARAHDLTAAEARVLQGLACGDRPDEIAARLAIAISTVRTQIGSIRSKTGARSINALLHRVSLLPPVVGVLRGQFS